MEICDMLKKINRKNKGEALQEAALQEKETNSLGEFFEILISGRNDLLSPNVAVVLFLCFSFVFMLIPWQVWMEDVEMVFITSLFFGISVSMYLNPYTRITESNRTASVLNKLKYYPADIRKIKKYLLIRTEKFVRRVFLTALVLQSVATLIAYQRLTFSNVLFVVVAAYIWPMINAFSIIVWSR